MEKRQKLSCRKEIRLSAEELKELETQAKAYGVKESEYMRLLITNRPRDYPDIQKELRRLANEMNHIGTNINQVVHNNNSQLYLESDKRRLYIYLKQLKELLREILEKL